MEAARQFLRHFLLALQFFTRIPVTGRLAAWVGYSPQMLQRCAAHFPAIGWLMGAAAAAVLTAALALLGAQPFAPLVAAVLASITTVWLTGGFHEDGLADTCDGLGGGATREKALHIMKDSRIGSYGTLALVLAIGLKVALLALLASRGAGMGAAALLGAHVLSRTAPLAQMHRLKYVGEADGSKSKPVVAEALPARSVAAGVLWAAPAVLLLGVAHGWGAAVAALLALLAALAYMTRLVQRRLQGFTGDTLGALQQAGELAVYLGLALGG